jgi:hypothetical protein
MDLMHQKLPQHLHLFNSCACATYWKVMSECLWDLLVMKQETDRNPKGKLGTYDISSHSSLRTVSA